MELVEKISEDIIKGSMSFNRRYVTVPMVDRSGSLKVSIMFKSGGHEKLKRLAKLMSPRLLNCCERRSEAIYYELAKTAAVIAKMCYIREPAATSAETIELLMHDCGLKLDKVDTDSFQKKVVGYIEWYLREVDPAQKNTPITDLSDFLRRSCPFPDES